MNNDIRYIIKTYPYLLDLYEKDDLLYIKNIYVSHVRHKRIIENEFSFLQFVSKLHELRYEPRKYSIIRCDTKKTFTEKNIKLKKSNQYQKKLDKLATEIKNSKNRVKIKLITPEPRQIKQKAITSKLKSLIRYYPQKTLKILQSSYGERKRRGLLADGFTFEKFVVNLHVLGFIDGSHHKICRIDTTKKYDESNIMLKKADGLLKKIENMSEIVHKNERVAIKINDETQSRVKV